MQGTFCFLPREISLFREVVNRQTRLFHDKIKHELSEARVYGSVSTQVWKQAAFLQTAATFRGPLGQLHYPLERRNPCGVWPRTTPGTVWVCLCLALHAARALPSHRVPRAPQMRSHPSSLGSEDKDRPGESRAFGELPLYDSRTTGQERGPCRQSCYFSLEPLAPLQFSESVEPNFWTRGHI